MGRLFERFDVEPVKGENITIGDHFPEVFISETDEVFCYAGICLCDREDRNRGSFMHPYYMKGKHSDDKVISKKTKGFYRIVDGCIILDNYVDAGYYSDRLYKKVNIGVRLPSPSSCYYAVFVNYEEDEDLTRGVFGLTYDELTELLEAYAKMMGTHSDFYTFPKLTRSITNTNFCDITELWIPEKFPYIAFNNSGYDFSHVSLLGFYRHIQLLTRKISNSLIGHALLKSGLDEEILKNVFDIGESLFHRTKVTRDIMW